MNSSSLPKRNFWWWFKLLFTYHRFYVEEKTTREKWFLFGMKAFYTTIMGVFMFVFLASLSVLQPVSYDLYRHQISMIYDRIGLDNPLPPSDLDNKPTIATKIYSHFFKEMVHHKRKGKTTKDLPLDHQDETGDNAMPLQMFEEKAWHNLIETQKKKVKEQGNSDTLFLANNPDEWPPLYQKAWMEVYSKLPQKTPHEFFEEEARRDPIRHIVYIQYHRHNGKDVFWTEAAQKPILFDMASMFGLGVLDDKDHSYPQRDEGVKDFLGWVGYYKYNAYLEYLTHQPDNQKETLLSEAPVLYGPVLAHRTEDHRNVAVLLYLALCTIAGVLVMMPSVQWESRRSEGVLEPMAMVLAPTWFHIARSSLDALGVIGKMAFALMAMVYVVTVGFVFDGSLLVALLCQYVVIMGVTFLGVQGAMFSVCAFQSYWGRILGRIMVLPIVGVCLLLYRAYWVSLLVVVAQGEAFNSVPWWGGVVVGLLLFLGGIILLYFSTKRVGKYRTGFVKLKKI